MIYDILGIGIGPSNLSVSALIHPVKQVSSLFLEKNKSFSWHKGMLIDGATVQVSFLKDLVTLVDPTNPFSFLNFLADKSRLYKFAITGSNRIKRKEFDQYYKWAIAQMENLQFNNQVLDINVKKDHFSVVTNKGVYLAKNLSIGTGLEPAIPHSCKNIIGERVFHSTHYLKQKISFKNKKVAIIGGGQSGAEILDHCLNRPVFDQPSEISWISNRYNFLPMDDSAFTNELYTPNYSEFFYRLPKSKRNQLLEKQKMSSDGIDLELIDKIYASLYERQELDGRKNFVHLRQDQNVEKVDCLNNSYHLLLKDVSTEDISQIEADIIILATGYRSKLPDFLHNIQGKFRDEDSLVQMNNDFSLSWDGPSDMKIYYLNGAESIWGLPNKNLSLNAWRASKIINSLLQEEHYPIDNSYTYSSWSNQNKSTCTPLYIVNNK